MGNKLIVYDVSAYIHTGANLTGRTADTNFRDRKRFRLPFGGVEYLLQKVSHDLANYRDIALCFDSYSFRKTLMPGYKAGRRQKPEIHVQMDLAYELLSSVGIPCYKVNGMEADDLVYTICEQARDTYRNIEVRSVDYDICHNVDNQVSFIPVNTKVNEINQFNFKDSISYSVEVRYNTITACKVFMGDKSDNVKKFVTEQGVDGSEMYMYFKQYLDIKKYYLPSEVRSREMLEEFFKVIKEHLTDNDLTELRKRMDIFFPTLVEGVEFIPFGINQLDKRRMSDMLSFAGSSYSLSMLDLPTSEIDKSKIGRYYEIAKSLGDGTYMVDHNLPVKKMNSFADSNLSLLKDF